MSFKINIETVWNGWKPRSDVKRPSWFQMPNEWSDHDDFYNFTDKEFRIAIHILSLFSRRQSNRIEIEGNLIEIKFQTTREVIQKTLSKLKQISILTKFTLRERSARVYRRGSLYRIGEDRNIKNNIKKEIENEEPERGEEGLAPENSSEKKQHLSAVRDAFKKGIKKLYGKEPNWHADRENQLSLFCEGRTLEEALLIVEAFLKSTDPFHTSYRHAFGSMVCSADKLLKKAKASRPPVYYAAAEFDEAPPEVDSTLTEQAVAAGKALLESIMGRNLNVPTFAYA